MRSSFVKLVEAWWIPHPARLGEILIMEALTASTCVKHSILSDINICRIYLRGFFLSDIVNIRGDKIKEWEINGECCNEQHSSWHWPVQQRPPRMMWNKWKAALLDVFTDESKISTTLGAWFDDPVHEEYKWWMNVRERCIYQQTNGELSQCADHTFSRLRFSTAPTPVPRLGQCSRTRYLEVTAKVDIVTSQDTVSTALHSYTSGVGLSFLYLPRHIQRLTGDIPALPTPLQFDLDEPRDLIIATDGSVLFGLGYHVWVLAKKDETILLRGGWPDDRIQSLMTSHRSGLGGLVAGLAVLGTLFGTGTINIQSV
jgi:hypothetical protein